MSSLDQNPSPDRREPPHIVAPVGFLDLHADRFVSYQLNRLRILGPVDPAALAAKTQKARRFDEIVAALARLSEGAERAGELRAAAAYARGVELLTDPRSSSRKPAYLRFRSLFERAYPGLVREDVPYLGASLPAYRLSAGAGGPPKAVLFHGGFDSLIEEFLVIWTQLAEAGFEVIAFEGPGQGGARIVGGLTFEHDWERPVSAILDHFGIAEAALVGLSMGGYWAIRAAGREPRITQVVAWPPVYDWLYQVPGPMRWLVRQMVRHRAPMNASIRLRMRLFKVLEHAVRHGMFIAGGEEPMDAVDWMLGMNHRHLESERVTQDVLLMVGEQDAFQPPRLATHQARALTSARSVSLRMFRASENAAQHCQLGNLDLACRVLVHWLSTGALLEEETRAAQRIR